MDSTNSGFVYGPVNDILIPTSSLNVFRHQPMTKGLTSQLCHDCSRFLLQISLDVTIWLINCWEWQ
jgi:hypothetical protein